MDSSSSNKLSMPSEASEIRDDIYSEKLPNLQQDKISLNSEKRLERENEKPNLNKSFYEFTLEIKKFIKFIGPGYLIAVGYLDPGNWATDLSAGSQFGYALLFIILCSNFMAMLLQMLAIKLGVVTGLDLAQACRAFYPKYVNLFLYVLCELAIIACDLAEVIGSAIALNLLFKIPLPWGVAITAVDVFIILFIYRENDMKSARILESLVMMLVGVVGVCFVLELVYAKPDSVDVLKGYLPSSGIFTNSKELYIAVSIVGATVMPHCIYLHSHLVKVRKLREENQGIKYQKQSGLMKKSDGSAKKFFKEIIGSTIKFSVLDSIVALTFALFVNSSILIVSAANFYYVDEPPIVANLFDAYNLLMRLGQAAAILFGVALLMAGQSSTLTATIAGQVVMEGFMGWKIRPWLRRLITRSFAIIPAMFIAILRGENGINELLVASQVALSIQLPFAVVPLVWFTSCKKYMRVDVRELCKRELDNEEDIEIGDDNGKIQSITEMSHEFQNSNSVNNDDEKYIMDFSNSYILSGFACIVSLIIISLDLYLVFDIIRGIIKGESID
ncbi:7338_t:CDS:2 [Diversispora eburnea]|uniref:7338_t:CDS:1 n=1 Tax=Diversispora eburnea TaxID=1213867 RepID=A0A9N8V2I5_9GLOM|nr:7338_t:CDS:2 [Diversispora eburnea]